MELYCQCGAAGLARQMQVLGNTTQVRPTHSYVEDSGPAAFSFPSLLPLLKWLPVQKQNRKRERQGSGYESCSVDKYMRITVLQLPNK